MDKEIFSYNIGYHYGLNTEYHDISIEILFAKLLKELELEFKLTKENICFKSFKDGYQQGLFDYKQEIK